jgi:hypothetical protein
MSEAGERNKGGRVEKQGVKQKAGKREGEVGSGQKASEKRIAPPSGNFSRSYVPPFILGELTSPSLLPSTTKTPPTLKPLSSSSSSPMV